MSEANQFAGKRSIDLNADLGESAESIASGTDRDLMRYISSANIACGGHAGDAQSMKRTLECAKALGVAAGAHPSYPDWANFGRTELEIGDADLQKYVQEQIAALVQIGNELGIPVRHVKPHGALYHAANRRREIALAIARAVMAVDSTLLIVGQAGSPCLDVWRGLGLACVGEAFADRAYKRDGSLLERKFHGALLREPARAARQALDIALRRKVFLGDGSELHISADTFCIHSDTPGAVAIARAVRDALKAAGIQIRAMSALHS